MSSNQWRQSMRFTLDYVPDDRLVSCVCGHKFDGTDNSHFRSCAKFRKSFVYDAHELLNNTYNRHMKKAGISTNTVARPRGLKKKVQPDGVQFQDDGSLAYWDVTSIHNTSPSYINFARQPGKLLDLKERIKCNKYQVFCNNKNAILIPLANETYGALGNATIEHVRHVAQSALDHGVVEDEGGREKLAAQMFTEISFAIQKGNAKLMMSCVQLSKTTPLCYNHDPLLRKSAPQKRSLRSNEASMRKSLDSLDLDILPLDLAEYEDSVISISPPSSPINTDNNKNQEAALAMLQRLNLSNLWQPAGQSRENDETDSEDDEDVVRVSEQVLRFNKNQNYIAETSLRISTTGMSRRSFLPSGDQRGQISIRFDD
jgi:hypothetical protein